MAAIAQVEVKIQDLEEMQEFIRTAGTWLEYIADLESFIRVVKSDPTAYSDATADDIIRTLREKHGVEVE